MLMIWGQNLTPYINQTEIVTIMIYSAFFHAEFHIDWYKIHQYTAKSSEKSQELWTKFWQCALRNKTATTLT